MYAAKSSAQSRITADLELAGVRVFDPGEKPVCGRYTLKAPREAIAEAFDLADVPQLLPRYNIAPTQAVPVVRLDPASGERGLSLLQWGLIPSWADDPAIGNRLINARAETVAEKPAFRPLSGPRPGAAEAVAVRSHAGYSLPHEAAPTRA